jgi:hypothetical protein
MVFQTLLADSVGIAAGYRLDGWGLITGGAQLEDWLWGLPSVPPNEYWGLKLTSHICLVPRSRMIELYFQSPTFSWYDN